MLSVAFSLLVLVFAAFGSSSPIQSDSATFTLEQTVAKAFTPGPVHLAQTYQKHNLSLSVDLLAAAERGRVETLPQFGIHDNVFLAPVSVGGQTLNLLVDTGSPTLWVYGSELAAKGKTRHGFYDPSKSKSSKKRKGSFDIKYVDYSQIHGDLYTDNVDIGGRTVTGQNFGLATKGEARLMNLKGVDGILGLAFTHTPMMWPKLDKNFVQNAIKQHVLRDNVFTADLKMGRPGTYDFGFVDPSKYEGEIHWVDVDDRKGFWGVNVHGYNIGTDDYKKSKQNGFIDTGTTFIIMHDKIVNEYYSHVPGAQSDPRHAGWIFPCTTTLPDFTLWIDKYNATVPGPYMNYGPLLPGINLCFGGLQSSQTIQEDTNIFGTIFIKSHFLIFDTEKKKLGIAQKKLEPCHKDISEFLCVP